MSKGDAATPDLQAIEEQIGQVIRSRNFWLPEDQDVIVALTKDIAALLLASQEELLEGLWQTMLGAFPKGPEHARSNAKILDVIVTEIDRIKQAKQELGRPTE